MKKAALDRDWLYQKYIVENLSWIELSKLAGCSPSFISKMIKQYGFKKDAEQIKNARSKSIKERYGVDNIAHSKEHREKAKKTNLDRYGVENVFQGNEFKEKIKETNLQKYGVENPSQSDEIKEKKRQTTFENFGVESPLQSEEIIKKVRETVLQKYGTDCTLKIPDVKQKVEEVFIQRYGVDNPFKSADVKKKIKETQARNGTIKIFFGKTPSAWSIQYGIPDSSIYSWLKAYPNCTEDEFHSFCQTYEHKISDIESLIKNYLGIDFWNKSPGHNLNYKPDFKLAEKIFLNADGLYWHCEKNVPDDYHFIMRKNFETAGLRLFQFRADEIYFKMPIIKSMINNALNQTPTKLGARKTILKEVQTCEAELFLNQNHIKGYKSAKHLGLYYNEELMAIMSYKKGSLNKYQFLKIERFCSKINTNVIGAFSKLLNEVIKIVGNMPIHYWVDLRYGTGNFLLNHGFSLDKETHGWDWTDLKITFNRLKCRANMDDRSLSEKEYAAELGWVKIWDAGQRLFVKK